LQKCCFKGTVHNLHLKISALYHVFHFKGQGIFQIAVFLQLPKFGIRRTSSVLSIFLVKKNRAKNSRETAPLKYRYKVILLKKVFFYEYFHSILIFLAHFCCCNYLVKFLLESEIEAITKKHQLLIDLNTKLESKYKTLR